jgi:succinate dehydrogenase / fumarate reductase flavoprotein subunit
VGMARNEAGLQATLKRIRQLQGEYWEDVRVPGDKNNLNKQLEFALRVADYLEFAEMMTIDALHRKESCGGHFREESQTADGEALRDDENYSYVAAWEFAGVGKEPVLHKEPLTFENVHLAQRNYA